MAQPVTALRQRRITAISLTLLVSIALWIFMFKGTIARFPVELWSGLALYAIILLLAAFNTRKKLPFIPLLSAATWLQIHIYVGFFSLILFGFHISFSWPRGTIEILLTIVFLLVCLSGIFGIFISRWLPKQMQLSGEPIIYEKIPYYRKETLKAVEACIHDAQIKTGSSTLPDFYLEKFAPYFSRPPHTFHAFSSAKEYQNLLQELKELTRYLDTSELPYHKQIIEQLSRKRHLDFMQSANGLLRTWLFIHIPFSCSLLILGLVHGFLALLYGGAH